MHKNQSWIRGLLIVWGMLTFAMAFFIPVFDFGFDGVVLWLFYSILLLIGMGGVTLGLRHSLYKSSDSEHKY